MMKRMMARTFNAPPQLPEGQPEWPLRSPADSACSAPDTRPRRPRDAASQPASPANPRATRQAGRQAGARARLPLPLAPHVIWAALIKKRSRSGDPPASSLVPLLLNPFLSPSLQTPLHGEGSQGRRRRALVTGGEHFSRAAANRLKTWMKKRKASPLRGFCAAPILCACLNRHEVPRGVHRSRGYEDCALRSGI